jgi:hypothetical protein
MSVQTRALAARGSDLHGPSLPQRVREKIVIWTLLVISFECDQNLWDARSDSMGRTQGVESHHLLGDHR